MKLKLLAALALLGGGVFAAAPTVYIVPTPFGTGSLATPANGNPPRVQIKPQAMPTGLTTVAATDAYIVGLVITNTTAGAITVTLQDGQGSPIALLGSNSIPANTTVVVNVPFGYWCPTGFSVQAGGAGLNYYATWNQ